MLGEPRKVTDTKRSVPPKFVGRVGSLLEAVLHAIGVENHHVAVGEFSLTVAGDSSASGSVRYVSKNDDPDVRIKHVYPTVPGAILVSVSGKSITVRLGANALNVVDSTAQAVAAAVLANTAAAALVDATALYQGTGIAGVTESQGFVYVSADGLQGAREDMVLRTARGYDLLVLGKNVGVGKPKRVPLTDDQFRRLIPVLSYMPRLTRASIERILDIVYGPKETAGWAVYEVDKKTITIELPELEAETRPATASYLRSNASTNQLTGDYFRSTVLQNAFRQVIPDGLAQASPIRNNSIYLTAPIGTYNVLYALFKPAKAAGINIVFKSPTE